MRKPLIAGNWKMHGSIKEVIALIDGIKRGVAPSSLIDIAIFPTFVHLSLAKDCLRDTTLGLGAQNLYFVAKGAFTGEVSGPMLKDMGCQYVLIGHSERRNLFDEDLTEVAKKFLAAIESQLVPVLCVGESLAEREQGVTKKIITEQIESVLAVAGIENFQNAVIAYEPIWAIGTGLTASPEQAQEVHAFIRELIGKNNVELAQTIRILYGGSMKADNAALLLTMPDIDGGLIGGASLEAKSFLAICAAAMAPV